MDSKSALLMRGEALFSVRPWPALVPNPGKFRWAVYRDGTFCGGVKTKADAERQINSGCFDADLEPVKR